MIIDFLKNEWSKDELAIALKVARHFKKCESTNEWMDIPFVAWTKLEQLEEFLDHMVTGAPLQDDTLNEIAAHEPT